MRFSCEKHLLLSAILNVSRAVPTRSSISALEGILFVVDRSIKLSGYNLEVGIREEIEADIEETGSVVVSARLLSEIVRRLPDERVMISLSKKMVLHIECGRAVFDIAACLDGQSFPQMPAVPEEESAVLSQKMLREMIQGTLFAVSENDTKKVHMGSKFIWRDNTLTLVSIDGFRMAVRRQVYEGKEPNEDFIVPGAALREVERLLTGVEENVRIVLGKRHILFQMGTVTLTTRLLEGEFINYTASIPSYQPISVSLDVKELKACIERVSLLINEKVKNPVRLKLEENCIHLSCTTALGAAQDDCPAQIEGVPEGQHELEIGFNHRYLLDALNALPDEDCIIKLSNPLSPCVMVPKEGESYLYMILPVRLRVE